MNGCDRRWKELELLTRQSATLCDWVAYTTPLQNHFSQSYPDTAILEDE